ncbi:Bug family tripartite tricarboxylate transporter substrate binding protein [Roseomonas xinghualingensis]|uniref:Bug family tripartite tricarboxylate transporter substrate binding protein n=1 Tax=Roseomonas xinghualingensis TaxID=2986475 RepID=UPI0021F0B3C6|nr:tripartite tricarboxylate transporter substrate binding protein [Roseomonas sp. SXEYE001]MCV4206958.1 tripartite tricarboxylate transporter substrate binding protein [Roseomonas sp. SXEYE001]
MRRRTLLGAAVATLALPAIRPSFAQGWRPTRPITMVVPFAAGSGTDAGARILAQVMSEALGGGAIVVDNRAGANGSIAAGYVARAEPDGHTLFVTTNTTHSANPALLKRLDYDPVADFAPIARVGNLPFMLVVGENSPVKDAKGFLEMARQRRGQMSYASGNSTGIVAGATMARLAGTEMLHVPYRSTPPAITDVIAGRVDCMFVDIAAGLGNLRAGKLRNLGMSTKDRSRLMPDTPTLAEAALPGFDITSWNGVFAPARTPAPVIEALNAAIRGPIERPEVKQRFAEIGFDAFSGTPQELGDFVKQQIVVWREMVEAAGIPKE